MGKNKIIRMIIAIAIVLIIAISVFLVIRYKNIHKVNSNIGITTALTQQDITRLQSYPYWFGKPVRDFDDINKKVPDLGLWIKDTLFGYAIKLESNEKFFTSEKLTYETNNYHYAIRGVLQTVLSDGEFMEQDVEFEYSLGDWNEDNNKARVIFEGQRFLNKRKMIGGE